MRKLRNGIKIIGIDHGYGNIRIANTVTPTRNRLHARKARGYGLS